MSQIDVDVTALGCVVDRGPRLAAVRAGARRVAGGLRRLGARRGRRDARRPRHQLGGACATPSAPFVLHDPLCPLTPPDVPRRVRRARAARRRRGASASARSPTRSRSCDGDAASARPSTGTALVRVVSPVVLPAAVVAALDGARRPTDLAALVAALRRAVPGRLLEAPPQATPGRRRGRPAGARGAHRAPVLSQSRPASVEVLGEGDLEVGRRRRAPPTTGSVGVPLEAGGGVGARRTRRRPPRR